MKTASFSSHLTSTLLAFTFILGLASCSKEVVEPTSTNSSATTARIAPETDIHQGITPIHPSHPIYHPDYRGEGTSALSTPHTPGTSIGAISAISDESELRTRNHNTICSMVETISTQEIFHPAYIHKVLIKDKR
jgi:hypothetical protein